MTNKTNSPDIIVEITKSGNRLNAFDKSGNKYTGNITLGARRKAFEGNYPLGRFTNKSGNYYWRQVSPDMMGTTSHIPTNTTTVDVPTEHNEVVNFIHNSFSLKPQGLVMKELKWKYLVRSWDELPVTSKPLSSALWNVPSPVAVRNRQCQVSLLYLQA